MLLDESTRPESATALHRAADAMFEQAGRQIAGGRQQSDMFFDSIKRMPGREEPRWDPLPAPSSTR